jgi:hypothetical protein
MIVNGEGAMAHERTSWHKGRIASLLNGLKEAKKLGKKAYLINTVWCQIEPHWSDVLKSLDGVWVRELSSQQEMEKMHGVKPQMYLDLSYSCPVDETKFSDICEDKDVVGTFYSRNMPRFGRFDQTSQMFKDMVPLSLGQEESETSQSHDWSHIVNSLKKARLYVTGQQHGVYAACRAKVPFACFTVHTHKISGLFKWAGVNIPIARNRWELKKAITWARTHRNVFDRLFQWMDERPSWPGI